MRVKDLKINGMYFSKSHQLVMKYCGVEYFQGHKYHSFYDASWKLFHWLNPNDVTPAKNKCHETASDSRVTSKSILP